MMNDPDVQAQVQVLSAALRAAQLDSVNEPKHKTKECLNEVSILDPSPASDNQMALSASSSQNDLSVAGILQRTDPGELSKGTNIHLETKQKHEPAPLEDNKPKLQDIVSQPLLDKYVSVTVPAQAQTVDINIAKHYAYSLPGVKLTLDRQNWHCFLKDT